MRRNFLPRNDDDDADDDLFRARGRVVIQGFYYCELMRNQYHAGEFMHRG